MARQKRLGRGGMTSELQIARQNRRARGELRMPFRSRKSSTLRWILLLSVLIVITGILGFSGVTHAAVGIAQILFAVFVMLLVLVLIFGAIRRRI